MMQVFFGDPGQKLFKGQLRFSDRCDNEFPICQRYFNRCFSLKSYLGSERFWDTQGKAVTPFLDAGSHVKPPFIVSTLKIPLLLVFVNSVYASIT